MRTIEEFLEGLEMTTLKTEFKIYTKQTVIDLMREYAEEYHKNEINKLNKSDVISSLDLNELERKLDDALAKETTESLNEWLNEKRQ